MAAASSTPTPPTRSRTPTPFTNLLEMLSIFAIRRRSASPSAAWSATSARAGRSFAAMGVLFVAGVAVIYWAEAAGNPPDRRRSRRRAGGNMEGKEVRFGIALSALFAVVTTAASCGAVNAMHDSFTPLGGMIPLLNMELGEVSSAASAPGSTACCCSSSSRSSSPA